MKQVLWHVIVIFLTLILFWSMPDEPNGKFSLGASIATLAVAYWTYKIAVKSYTQVERESPWKLVKLEDSRWILERMHPSVATVYGYRIIDYRHGENVFSLNKKVEFYDGGNRPLRWFMRGTNMVMEIPDAGVGSSLYLFYEEHKDPKQAIVEGTYNNQIDYKYMEGIMTLDALGWGTKKMKWELFKYRYFSHFCKVKESDRKRRMTSEEMKNQIDILQRAIQVKVWRTSLY